MEDLRSAISMEEGDLTPIPHILMVSFIGQGNLNPLLRLAKRFAAKGLLVTFTSPSETGRRILSSTDNCEPGLNHPVGGGFLRFEFLTDDLALHNGRTFASSVAKLSEIGPKIVTEIIRRQADAGCPVSCLIYNPFVPWVLDVAAEMGIPGAHLWIQSCAVLSVYYYYHRSLAEFPTENNPDVAVALPGMPELKPDELPTFLFPSDPRNTFLLPSDQMSSIKTLILQQFDNISKASWVFINSFEELEPEAIKSISGRLSVIPVGPLLDETDNDASRSSIRGDMLKAADCSAWLDAQEPRSVVYVSFGSQSVLSKEQMAEMAYGLESCGHPFLWVVRNDVQKFLPEGFTEEIKDKGLIVAWTYQERVLSHVSVACFLTHCGWNSTLEAVTAGTPVITYPLWGDQVTDAKFLVDVYRVGVRLPAPVLRDELQRCVEAVTRGPEAEEIRRRAAEWSQAAREAAAESSSSDRNIQAFVDEIRRRACRYTSASKH